MKDIKQILKVHFKDCTNFGSVDAKSISEAEEVLNITFPPSYRTYLTEYGASYGSCIEIYGLPVAQDPPEWVNAAQQTLNDRKSTNISHGYLAISDDGGDFRYYLDCASPNTQGECPVVKVGPGVETFEIVANSFAEFASQLCLP